MHPATCSERGIFGLGNPFADEVALRWALQHSDGHNNGVVVYGTGIDALSAVGSLMTHIAPERITLVTPDADLEEMGHETVRALRIAGLYDFSLLLIIRKYDAAVGKRDHQDISPELWCHCLQRSYCQRRNSQ
jgi:hypothetical protein